MNQKSKKKPLIFTNSWKICLESGMSWYLQALLRDQEWLSILTIDPTKE